MLHAGERSDAAGKAVSNVILLSLPNEEYNLLRPHLEPMDLPQHLILHEPGEKIELELLPDGRGVIKAARRSGKIEDFFGVLAGKTKKVATIEEINQAVADGWAGLVKMGETKMGEK